MASRRRFIQIIPFAGVGLLAACNKPATPSSPVAAAPVAAPAPVAATPAAPAATPMPTPAPPPNATAAVASTATLVDEKDANSVSLGYVSDATRADAAKFKSYAAGQKCGNCALFQGKDGEASGACPLYVGRQVSANGWCSAYSKKG